MCSLKYIQNDGNNTYFEICPSRFNPYILYYLFVLKDQPNLYYEKISNDEGLSFLYLNLSVTALEAIMCENDDILMTFSTYVNLIICFSTFNGHVGNGYSLYLVLLCHHSKLLWSIRKWLFGRFSFFECVKYKINVIHTRLF